MSSTKNIIQPYKIIDAASMAGNITSATVGTKYIDNVAFSVVWTGTPTGTFSVECSVDNSTFIALTFGAALTAPAGAAGSFLVDLNEIPFPYVRFKYTATSGTGSLTVWVSGKVV